MKKIKIHSILSNSDNETTIVDEEVMFDEVDNVITYMEDDLKVSISIFETFVKMRRCNEDYDLNLEFDLNEDKVCKYSVKSIALDLDLLVRTKELEIYDNRVYIKYELFNDQKSIGEFEYKLIIRE